MSSRSKSQSGQAAVESALVLPLYMFVMLGTLQLALMHQARLMTKYAAYKAARTGSIHNARVDKMKAAAVAVLLPMISEAKSGGAEAIPPVNGASNYLQRWVQPQYMNDKMPDTGLEYAEVVICGPTTADLNGSDEVDFDDPDVAAKTNWKESEATKLRVQVTFNYRMPIPFANWVIERTAMNAALPWVIALNSKNKGVDPNYTPPSELVSKYGAIAESTGVFVLPIRATYTMRMQSNIYVNQAPIPSGNKCIFSY